MATLYEIDNAILDCVDMETGEIVDADALDALQLEREAKIESVACWIKELKISAEALKAEKMALAERQKVAENKMESLKNWLAYALNGSKFESTKAKVSFRKTQSVEVTDVYAVAEFDSDLVKYGAPEPNKTAIKQALNDGVPVVGAKLNNGVSVIVK